MRVTVLDHLSLSFPHYSLSHTPYRLSLSVSLALSIVCVSLRVSREMCVALRNDWRKRERGNC